MDNALPGTQTYDFRKVKWSGNLREVHSLIPVIETMLKEKALFHLFDFDAFPSPVPPHQALYLEQQDRTRYGEATAKHATRVQENAAWEQNYGQLRDVEHIILNRYDEDHFWWMHNHRPKEAKLKLPKSLCQPHHKKEISEHPKEVKKELEECHSIIKV